MALLAKTLDTSALGQSNCQNRMHFSGPPKTVWSLIGFPDGFTCDDTFAETVSSGEKGLYFDNGVSKDTDSNFIAIIFRLPTDGQLKDPLYYPQPLESFILHKDPLPEEGSRSRIEIVLNPHLFVNLPEDDIEFYPSPNDITCTNKFFGELHNVPVPPKELTFTMESIFSVLTESKTLKKLVIPSQVKNPYTKAWVKLEYLNTEYGPT